MLQSVYHLEVGLSDDEYHKERQSMGNHNCNREKCVCQKHKIGCKNDLLNISETFD